MTIILIPITQCAWNLSKYGVSFGSYFPVFSPNTGEFAPEITPYLDTFHAVANTHYTILGNALIWPSGSLNDKEGAFHITPRQRSSVYCNWLCRIK